MQNVKTREFEKKLKRNGFHFDRQNGDHGIFERKQSISIPLGSKEINGCMAQRLTKEYNLK